MRGLCFITICSWVLISCNYREVLDVEAYRKDHNFKMGGAFDKNTIIGLESVQKISLNNCFSCHSGKSQPTLTTGNQIRSNVLKILSDVGENKMPPAKAGYSPLVSCQKDILQKWYDLGMPNQSNVKVVSLESCKTYGGETGPGDIPIEQMPVNYNTFLEKILKPKCIQCHNPDDNTEAAKTLFFPYVQLLENRGLFKTPGERAKIVRDVTRDDEDRMPPPPPESDVLPLTSKEVEFLIKWIDAGLPE